MNLSDNAESLLERSDNTKFLRETSNNNGLDIFSGDMGRVLTAARKYRKFLVERGYTKAPEIISDIADSQVYKALVGYPEAQKIYQYIVEQYAFWPEFFYSETQRLGKNKPGHISQNNLEHIEAGIEIVKILRKKIQPLFDSPEEMNKEAWEKFWNDVMIGWLVHDIGEWGMMEDITSDLRSDYKENQEDLDEQENAIMFINKISDEGIREIILRAYLAFEHRTEYLRDSKMPHKHNLLGNVIRFVDKIEALNFNHHSGIIKWRLREWEASKSTADIKDVAYGKIIEPLSIVAPYMSLEGKNVLLEYFNELLDLVWHLKPEDKVQPDLFGTEERPDAEVYERLKSRASDQILEGVVNPNWAKVIRFNKK